MRKNAVNKQLNVLEGGICAVSGFTANTVRCGLRADTEGDDVGIVVSDKKCAVAFLGDSSPMAGAPVKVSRRHVQFGHARGILCNNGIANAYGEQSERIAKLMCWEVAKRLKIDAVDFVIASTGEIGKTLDLDAFAAGVPQLVRGLDCVKDKDLAFAQVLDATQPKQLAFSFQLGDFTCKIGAVFKGNQRVAPNFATTLCFMTTDVNISSEMLQKALTTVVNDTFNQLSVDCISSPNDCVCILANGKAGNYQIAQEDTEYKKFIYVLGETLDKICKCLVSNPEKQEEAFLCKVKGARSKKLARHITKSVVTAVGIKERLQYGLVDVQDLLCCIIGNGESIELNELKISVQSQHGVIVLFEDAQPIKVERGMIEKVVMGEDFCVELDFKQGNYTATAYGRKQRAKYNDNI